MFCECNVLLSTCSVNEDMRTWSWDWTKTIRTPTGFDGDVLTLLPFESMHKLKTWQKEEDDFPSCQLQGLAAQAVALLRYNVSSYNLQSPIQIIYFPGSGRRPNHSKCWPLWTPSSSKRRFMGQHSISLKGKNFPQRAVHAFDYALAWCWSRLCWIEFQPLKALLGNTWLGRPGRDLWSACHHFSAIQENHQESQVVMFKKQNLQPAFSQTRQLSIATQIVEKNWKDVSILWRRRHVFSCFQSYKHADLKHVFEAKAKMNSFRPCYPAWSTTCFHKPESCHKIRIQKK